MSNMNMSSEEIVVSFDASDKASKGAGPVELGRRLLGAARDGDSDAVLELLGLGAPFSTDWLGTSPLHLAAANDRADVCAVLLRAGVSRDYRTKVERTPLHLAAYWGHANTARLLLQHGADANARDLLGMTPLHWAAEREHAAVARLLLQHGADPHLQSRFLTTPMQLAAGEALPVLMAAARDASPAPPSPPPAPEAPDPVSQEEAADPPPSAAAADLLLRHGISLLPPDDAGTVMRALLSGRTVLLSDAGKLMLQENAKPAPAPSTPTPLPPRVRPLVPAGPKAGARRPLRVVLNKSSVDRLASPVSSDEEAEGVVRVPDQFLRSQDPEYLRAQLLAAHAALQRLRRRLKARKARPPDDT